MTSTERRVNFNFRANLVGFFFSKAKALHDVRQVSFQSSRIRIESASFSREFVFANCTTHLETIVPNVERFEVATKASFDDFSHLSNFRRRDEFNEHLFYFLVSHLHLLIKRTLDIWRISWTIFVHCYSRFIDIIEHLVTHIGFASVVNNIAFGIFHFIGIRIPSEIGIRDDFGRDRLVDDTSHDLINHALFFKTTTIGISIVRF